MEDVTKDKDSIILLVIIACLVGWNIFTTNTQVSYKKQNPDLSRGFLLVEVEGFEPSCCSYLSKGTTRLGHCLANNPKFHNSLIFKVVRFTEN